MFTQIRAQIDSVDAQMRRLFTQRMELSRNIARAKAEQGGKIYRPEREAEVIANNCAGIDVDLLPYYRAYIRHMLLISRQFQYRMTLDNTHRNFSPDDNCGINFEKDFTCEEDHDHIEFSCVYDNETKVFTGIEGLCADLDVEIEMLSLAKAGSKTRCRAVIIGSMQQRKVLTLLYMLCAETEDFKVKRCFRQGQS